MSTVANNHASGKDIEMQSQTAAADNKREITADMSSDDFAVLSIVLGVGIVALLPELLVSGFIIIACSFDAGWLLNTAPHWDTEPERRLGHAVAALCVVLALLSAARCLIAGLALIFAISIRERVSLKWCVFAVLCPIILFILDTAAVGFGSVFIFAGKRWMSLFDGSEHSDNAKSATLLFSMGIIVVIWRGISVVNTAFSALRGCSKAALIALDT